MRFQTLFSRRRNLRNEYDGRKYRVKTFLVFIGGCQTTIFFYKKRTENLAIGWYRSFRIFHNWLRRNEMYGVSYFRINLRLSFSKLQSYFHKIHRSENKIKIFRFFFSRGSQEYCSLWFRLTAIDIWRRFCWQPESHMWRRKILLSLWVPLNSVTHSDSKWKCIKNVHSFHLNWLNFSFINEIVRIPSCFNQNRQR